MKKEKCNKEKTKLTLGQKQRVFTLNIAKLITFAYEQGYELTLGDAYRDPRVFGALGERKGYGQAGSNHKQRLAQDLNLFKGGKYLQETEDHKPLGEHWESLHEENSWGGHFNDGNHYSMTHNGHR